MNKRYQVFISSTYADLKEERSKVIQTIMELDCIPAGMEIFPAIDEEQFEFIKKIIDDCDYYILIIGGRYGSLSEEGISYTEMEYDYAVQKNIKIIAFVHSKPDEIALGKSEKDADLRQKLQEFRNKVSTNRLIRFWERADELPGLVALSLSKTIKTYPATGWIRANVSINPEIYKELNEIRKENLELKSKIASDNEVKSETITILENLAEFDDAINVSGNYRYYTTTGYRNSNWEKVVSWKTLFSLLSPYLMENPADTLAKSKLSEIIYQTTPDNRSDGTATINDQIFQTIKIHLKALGLIDVKYLKTTKGGMDLFWKITEKGEKLMMDLRSVKK
jgi:hypothetical protein